MKFEDYRVLFLIIVAIAALLVASPALSRLLVYRRTEFFTELWLLGQNHMAEDYPYNITRGQSYGIFLGIANHLGYVAYYLVEAKFRNQTQSAPTSIGPSANRTPSTLPSLYNVTAFVADEGICEKPLTISFDYGYDVTHSRTEFHTLSLNGVVLDLRGYETTWNPLRREFSGNLFFELWIRNTTTGNFEYHERFVGLNLNMTG